MSAERAGGDRVAVVTGAGSGIGREIARALLGAGYRVVLVGRNRSPLEETAAGAGVDAGQVLVAPADVSVSSDVADVFRHACDAWGRVDLLVNNAGTFGPVGDIDEIDEIEWRRTVDVNLTGAFLCAKHAVRVMKSQTPQGGRIINNGSISAHVPRPGSVAYTATKHAMTGLTKAISLDGRPYGIACGQIDIGNAATDMTAGIADSARQADGSMRAEPTFDPVHVAEAVLQMARLPLDVNVQFMTIMATTMPYVGRG
jgi:NAD(P)-dependent dehydrogenase (short-subunit alcohol dehydrogenase family)